MTTPITNVPRGLLSLLGLRDFGATPRFCEETIAPGIDVTQFLLLNRESIASPLINVSTLTSATSTETTVPPGELWYVHWQTVQSSGLAAGETIGLQPGYQWQGIFFATGDTVRATAGHRASVAAWEGYWAPAGSEIGLRTNEITTTGSIGCAIGLNITRLRI